MPMYCFFTGISVVHSMESAECSWSGKQGLRHFFLDSSLAQNATTNLYLRYGQTKHERGVIRYGMTMVVKSCKTCGFANFHKKHAISYLNVHHRRDIHDHNIADPISHLFNQLPQSKPTSPKKIEFWEHNWPTIWELLAIIDAHQHPTSDQHQYIDEHPGKAFTTWIDNPFPNHNE
ncbi:hypothetical protein BDC45DRAFT_531679 [Circinella umbellata]|nr:hypothetical protein BDC45DRAFT_531679 [Circinella umbellata]